MADLGELQSAPVTKIAGANATTGTEDYFVDADGNGNMKVVDYATGTTGSAVPSAGSYLAGKNPSGNLQGVSVDATGNIQVVGNIASGATDSGNPLKIGGVFNAVLPVVSSGQRVDLQLDQNGRLLTSSVSLPTSASKFSFGDVTTAAQTQVAVERTAYVEQTTNAAMTIVSSSAADTAAGTGARSVTITYLDSTMAGPYTTTIALNGTVAVAAGVSNMCYIEKIQVATVGSGGVNAGTLTLKSGATTVGTVAVGDNQTFWAHHYVPTGKTSYVSGFSVNSNGTTSGSGALFILKASTPTIASTPEIQVSDFHRLYGQQSSTDTRSYISPIQIVGPARVKAYVTPETTTSTTYRASFDFIDN